MQQNIMLLIKMQREGERRTEPEAVAVVAQWLKLQSATCLLQIKQYLYFFPFNRQHKPYREQLNHKKNLCLWVLIFV